MRPFDDLCKEDPNLLPLSKYGPDSDGVWKDLGPLSLQDFYDKAKESSLDERIPENIRNIFEVAQNLLVYHFFEKSFIAASDLYASMAIEATLRDYCKIEIIEYCRKRFKPGRSFPIASLTKVCEIFIEKVEIPLNQEEYDVLKGHLTALRGIRNFMAHPKNHYPLWITYSQLPQAKELIESIYANDIGRFLKEQLEMKKRAEQEQKDMLEATKAEQNRIALQSRFFWNNAVLMQSKSISFAQGLKISI